jgi:hypothetical protein
MGFRMYVATRPPSAGAGPMQHSHERYKKEEAAESTHNSRVFQLVRSLSFLPSRQYATSAS